MGSREADSEMSVVTEDNLLGNAPGICSVERVELEKERKGGREMFYQSPNGLNGQG